MVLRAAEGEVKRRFGLQIRKTLTHLRSRRGGGLLAQEQAALGAAGCKISSRSHSKEGFRGVPDRLLSSRGRTHVRGYGVGAELRAQIAAFNRDLPVDEAWTPPSSWYISSRIFDCELRNVFERRWLAVGETSPTVNAHGPTPESNLFSSFKFPGRTAQLQKPGDYFTGKVGRIRYVVCVDEDRTVRAFHNVCRHHAAAVAGGSGCSTSFVCPYHGWTYGLDGKLRKAPRLGGIQKFSARENGLLPLQANTWGPFVLISSLTKPVIGDDDWHERTAESEWLGDAAEPLMKAKMKSSLVHVRTREYMLNCNWKVFCDNYLDGGYHVQYAHRDLASNLDLKSYKITAFDKVSLQSCQGSKQSSGDVSDRVGEGAAYAFVYPNFMINRYGPWMDTNTVVPLTPDSCRVIFDYYLESNALDATFIEEGIRSSDVVQQEDIALCEAVQDGLQSPAYDVGRYAPKVEHAMHHFHCLLYDDLAKSSGNACNGVHWRRLQAK